MKIKITLLAALAAVALAACNSSNPSVSPADTAPRATVEAAAAPVEDSAGIMPDVVGMDLQTAEDTIQVRDRSLRFSDSRDASGQDRMQLVDRNWTVVRQSPAVGTVLHADDVPMLDAASEPGPPWWAFIPTGASGGGPAHAGSSVVGSRRSTSTGHTCGRSRACYADRQRSSWPASRSPECIVLGSPRVSTPPPSTWPTCVGGCSPDHPPTNHPTLKRNCSAPRRERSTRTTSPGSNKRQTP